jgi:hypothetical protein
MLIALWLVVTNNVPFALAIAMITPIVGIENITGALLASIFINEYPLVANFTTP